MNTTLTALKGVKVGHSTDLEKLTGCTVVVFDNPYPVAYKATGGTPRVYDSKILDEGKSFFRKHAIYISDGAHAGLETAAFISKALRKKKIGYQIGKNLIPSITGACVQSLGLYINEFNPECGYEAVQDSSNTQVKAGNVGAGTGTSVGKFSWTESGLCLAMKTGVGSARIDLGHGLIVSALTVVNALGNIIDMQGGILAGNRHDNEEFRFRTFEGFADFLLENSSNTTISIVGTNAKLKNQEDLRKIAEIATHGQIRAINPLNTSLDGDTVFVFSTEEQDLHLSSIGKTIAKGDWYKIGIDILAQTAAKAVQESIYDACYQAETIKFESAYKGIIPSVKDCTKS